MTKQEVCQFLLVSTRTLDRWRSLWRAKKLDPLGEVKIRRKTRFRRVAVEKLIQSPKMWLQKA